MVWSCASDRTRHMFIDSVNQRWRGRVNGHHFVVALRSYYREKLDKLKSAKNSARPTAATGKLSYQDESTLEYINTARVQAVIEAFDDDASGFITLAEVNTFTNACPENWRYVVYVDIII